jgi:hypothetical protein
MPTHHPCNAVLLASMTYYCDRWYNFLAIPGNEIMLTSVVIYFFYCTVISRVCYYVYPAKQRDQDAIVKQDCCSSGRVIELLSPQSANQPVTLSICLVLIQSTRSQPVKLSWQVVFKFSSHQLIKSSSRWRVSRTRSCHVSCQTAGLSDRGMRPTRHQVVEFSTPVVKSSLSHRVANPSSHSSEGRVCQLLCPKMVTIWS